MELIDDTDDPAVFGLGIQDQLEVFLNEYRSGLLACLDGLSEAQAKLQLVPSATTLLGLVKHAMFVEQVWFGQALTGQSRAELGIVEGPDESFVLEAQDTIRSVSLAYEQTIKRSRSATNGLSPDDILTGNRRGELPLRWIYLHVLRELAQHAGHADILREQVLAR